MDGQVLNWGWVVCSIVLLGVNLWVSRECKKAKDLADDVIESQEVMMRALIAVAEGRVKVSVDGDKLRFEAVTKGGV